MHHKFIEEMGRYANGKQWVHVFKTNVKSRCTLTADSNQEEILIWDGDLLSKARMEALAFDIDPNFKYPGKRVVGATTSAPAGFWASRRS